MATRLDFRGNSVGKPLTICPGEDHCDDWNATRGKDHAAKEKSVCSECPAFPTKIRPGAVRQVELTEKFVNRVALIRQQKLAGFPIDTTMVTEAEFRTLCEMEDQFAAYRELADHAIRETYRLVKSHLGAN